MNKVKEIFKKLWEKFKSFSKGVRIALIVALVAVLLSIVALFVFESANKYQILFSDLDPADAQVVTAALKEQKVDMKVEGNSILVDKSKVDELRLGLAPSLSGGSKGYELMDDSSSFGMTDEEFKLKKQRMLQGELEKTIKSFPQVQNVRVHITPAKDSVFAEDKQPGKAAVILDLKPGNKLDQEQVKSIVALVSGSADNIPKENIEVIDQNMTLLSQGLDFGKGDSTGVSQGAIASHHNLEADYEAKLQKEILTLLEPVIGKGKIRANVNVDMDFDSKQKTETVIDPNKVIVSQQTIKDVNSAKAGAISESPVDNNMSNTIDDSSKDSVNSTKEEQKTNYESGKTETKTISAPGEVKRMTASVVIDGKLDQALTDAISQSVENAIGFDNARGDKISVLGMEFDPSIKQEQEKQVEEFNQQVAAEKRNKMIMYGAIGAGILALIIIALIVFRRKKNAEEEMKELDIVIDDNAYKEEEKFNPIDFEVKDEKKHIENEIKKYAQDKPEQVVDIIKSWLNENER